MLHFNIKRRSHKLRIRINLRFKKIKVINDIKYIIKEQLSIWELIIIEKQYYIYMLCFYYI